MASMGKKDREPVRCAPCPREVELYVTAMGMLGVEEIDARRQFADVGPVGDKQTQRLRDVLNTAILPIIDKTTNSTP